MERYPKIAIVYLSFHCEPYMDDVVSALKKLTYPKDKIEFVIVDNPHPEYGPSLRYIEETVMPLSGTEIPHVTVLPQAENLGFAGGNNVGSDWAIKNNFDYVFFHNNDGFFAANALEPLVEAMETDKQIGIAQSMMLLHPDTELINSSGNKFHYLGFGYCNHYRVPYKDLKFDPITEISYASGAAMMVSTDLIKKYGAWDNDYFLYHEDTDWSFRLRVLGYKIVMVRDSIFYHKYQFSRSITKFYWMERNRFGVMLIFFRWPTLILLLPIATALEIGLWFYAFKNGWWQKKVEVYKYWIKPSSWRLWLKKRKHIQSIRKVSDRQLMAIATSEIKFQDKSVDNPLVHYLANPVMKIYYYLIVRSLIWW